MPADCPSSSSGRCIPRTLQCSGEDDCGDMSDEAGCKKVSKPCREEVEEYWGIENLAKGWVTFSLVCMESPRSWKELCIHVALLKPSFRINILNSNLEGVVLDNRYYAGSCLPQYIQDVRFRKPYNLQQYTLQVNRSLKNTSVNQMFS